MDEERMQQSALMRRLASLRLTCAALALLAIAVLASQWRDGAGRAWLALPLVLLAVNLLAALVTRGALRRRPALALFHVALMGVCALGAIETVVEFEGRVEMVEGQTFDARDLQAVRGGLGGEPSLSARDIVQGPIDVAFERELSRQRTHSTLAAGGERHDVSDGAAVTLDGLRFAVSSNKGFALVLLWHGDDGTRQLGSVNLPSYPALEWKQEQAWRTPAGETLRLGLTPPPRPPQRWSLRALLPAAKATVRTDGGVRELQRNVPLRVQGGSLTLQDVRLWMGYRVDRQPLLGSMLVLALLGIGALAWHVLRVHFGMRGTMEASVPGNSTAPAHRSLGQRVTASGPVRP